MPSVRYLLSPAEIEYAIGYGRMLNFSLRLNFRKVL
jgi:hypothetical protein